MEFHAEVKPLSDMEFSECTHPESRVLLIGTGGTICMQPTPDGLLPIPGFLERAMAPRPCFNDRSTPKVQISAVRKGEKILIDSLRTPPSAYSKHIRYGMIEFDPLLDSSSITAQDWKAIADTVNENYSLFDGFVILHGTDSLAYSASALSFMMEDLGKPVILTGAQASIFALQSDAVDNLLGSLIIAGTFVIPEVCLFFHHKLFRGNRTAKVSASSFEAFESPNCEPLAKVSGLGIDVNWSLVLRPKRIAEFKVTRSLDTAHVACLWMFPGIKPEMVDSVLQLPNIRGLVLASFGMGNTPACVGGGMTKVIRKAIESGTIVVNVSQCSSGFVSPIYGPGTQLGRAGVIFGHDLTIEAALTKLQYLLALPGVPAAEVTKLMSLSLRGEMTERRLPVFSHPSGTLDTAVGRLTTADAAFTALGYAIRNGDLRTVTEILDSDEVSLLKKVDYAGNTCMHLAAICHNADIMRLLLTKGASVHSRNWADNTPLFLAEKAGNADCVVLLKEAGAHLWRDLDPTEESNGVAAAVENGKENGVGEANGVQEPGQKRKREGSLDVPDNERERSTSVF